MERDGLGGMKNGHCDDGRPPLLVKYCSDMTILQISTSFNITARLASVVGLHIALSNAVGCAAGTYSI